MKVIAIDAGTNNIKSQVFDGSGPISDIVSVPSSQAFNLKKGIVITDIYFKSLIECVEKTFALLKDKNITALGLTTIGPSLILCNDMSCNRIARIYNYPFAKEGEKEILKMNLYHERGLGTGSQYTPEQIIQLKNENNFGSNPFFTTLASYLCHLLGGDLYKWTYPEASYNGLLSIKTGQYSRKIFQNLQLNYNWFPTLTSGQVGYLSKWLISKFKLDNTRNILIYNFGTDGPSTQAYLGKNYATLKIESTGAYRVKVQKPIFDNKPYVKGYPGVWNIYFKEQNGEKYFISGATMNAGVNTIKHFFPNISDSDLNILDENLIKLFKKGIPDINKCGIELPFEFGERDGIKRKFGIQGKKPKEKLILYYAVKEGIMFNMIQRIALVRNAQILAGNKLNNKFLLTGPIIQSKPWQELLLILLNKIIKIKNPILVCPIYKENGLVTTAKGIFKKLGMKDKIPLEGDSFKLKNLYFQKNKKNIPILIKRWEEYNKYYNN